MAEKPNFTGKWVIDLKASDPIAPILEEHGLSWPVRSVINKMSVTHIIEQTDEYIKTNIVTSIRQRTEQLPLDGSKQNRVSEDLGEVETSCQWGEYEGKPALVTTLEPVKIPGIETVSRYLSEDGKMILFFFWRRKDGSKEVTAKRVFNKQE